MFHSASLSIALFTASFLLSADSTTYSLLTSFGLRLHLLTLMRLVRTLLVVAGGGAGAGASVVGGLTESKIESMISRYVSGVDPDALPTLQKGMFTILNSAGVPHLCGFFVTDCGVALTVNHDFDTWCKDGIVTAVMLKSSDSAGAVSSSFSSSSSAAAVAASDSEVGLTFRVHSSSPPDELDYTCLILETSVNPGTFVPLEIPKGHIPTSALLGRPAALLNGSIALNKFFHEDPSMSYITCNIFCVHPKRVLYSAATAGGDSGGALLLYGRTLVAMHIEGLNDVPEDIEVLSPSAAGTSSTDAKKTPKPKRLRLSEASPSTTASALRLDIDEIKNAIDAAKYDNPPSKPVSLAGNKRKREDDYS